MDTGAGVAFPIQEVLQGIGAFLGLHKNQSQRVLTWWTERESTTEVKHSWSMLLPKLLNPEADFNFDEHHVAAGLHCSHFEDP